MWLRCSPAETSAGRGPFALAQGRWEERVGRVTPGISHSLRAFEEEVGRGRELPPPAIVRQRPVVEAPFAAMFQSGMIGRTITAALTVMAVNVSVYGFVAWLVLAN